MSDCRENTVENYEEDAALVCNILMSGKKELFEIIVNRYRRPVMTLIFRMTGDYDVSLDLAQETFLKAWKYLKSYRHDMKFSSWLFKIAVNLAKDYQVKHNKTAAHEEPLEDNLGNTVYKEKPEVGLYVESLLGKLQEPYKTALILRFMKDLTYNEISEIMEVTVEQVKNFIFRGRKKCLHIAGEETCYEMSCGK
jgi:RNA polymerase sigma-70 factor, ECF subfamily